MRWCTMEIPGAKTRKASGDIADESRFPFERETFHLFLSLLDCVSSARLGPPQG